MTQVLKVAVPTPLRRIFDYLPPESASSEEIQHLQPGTRVVIPFGSQQLVGIIVGLSQSTDLSPRQLKAVTQLLHSPANIPTETLELCQWAASYYQHPVGDAISTALPVLLRQPQDQTLQGERHWVLSTEGKGLSDSSLKRAPKQAQLWKLLLNKHSVPHDDIIEQAFSSTIKELEKKGLAEVITVLPAANFDSNDLLKEPALALNEEQQSALSQIRYQQFATYLLEGATGSGKTEVYLHAVEECLRHGNSALVLVPEIGLTPQLVGRFKQRFKVTVATLHSGLNDTERMQNWLLAHEERAHIVIGTRSAIFTPLPKLGLIIIDEEHDLSFKQQEGFRYSARDLAIVRAQRLNIPVVMGTATPSLESLYNSTHNRYLHLRLTQRAGNAVAPKVELIDIRQQKLNEGFSPALMDAIQLELDKGNQVLVFINRRGFAPLLMCHDCGWMAHCNHCSARMTVHQHPPHLHCHHCDHQRPINNRCPDCFGQDLEYHGLGTERSEATLQQNFPDTPVIRIDRDTTRRKHAMSNMLEQIHRGDSCILVGTQMLAKGHHFPDITLVAILDIDSGLFSPDFRGPERMGQLLIQVAGRAGRAAKPGKVMIQSHHCDHPSIQSLIKEGYHRYARRLLHERQVTGLPPYRHMALLRSESKRVENAIELLKTARQIAQNQFPSSPQLSYLGPIPALMEKKKDRFCFQLHISSEQRPLLKKVLNHLCNTLESHPMARRARWSVDVDPQDMS